MIDLHTHSTASDGSLSPTELVSLAESSGITYLALTDHNTIHGLQEFLHAAEGTKVKPIPGIELSSELDNHELHILALNLPQIACSQVDALMSDVLRRKEASNRSLVDALRRIGYDIDYDAICAANPNSVVVRVHIAEALIEKGYVSSVTEAFSTLLEENVGYYHPPKRLKSVEAIQIIRDLGAIPIWAHPFLRYDEKKVAQTLSVLSPAGLVGMEVYYSTYTPAQTASAQSLAKEYHLKPSGGSDFHGIPKPDISLGIGRGNLNIPEEIAENLLKL